jgi:indolepyruvate ferredoxin oxidoreductase
MYTSGDFEALLKKKFDGVRKLEFHLAPPLLSWWKRDKQTGHPYKITFGPWMMRVFRLLAKGKHLRGGTWDIFGYTSERKQERQMITEYEALLDRIVPKLTSERHAVTTQLAGLPMEIKGFGHVKEANYDKAKDRQRALLEELDNPAPIRVAAE